MEIAKGSIVLIENDLASANRYEVLKIKNGQAKIRIINPCKSVCWIDLEEIQIVPETREQVILDWRQRHDYSGI
jgi:hypothetical protein